MYIGTFKKKPSKEMHKVDQSGTSRKGGSGVGAENKTRGGESPKGLHSYF